MGQAAAERGPRVVVIDGDGDIRDLLEAMLDVAEEFRLVKVIADTELGVEAVRSLQPDAVVLDLDDPELEGMEMVIRLREVAPGTRIIVISAFPDPVTLIEALRHGADEYLDKARAWADLLPTIQHLCASPVVEPSARPSDRRERPTAGGQPPPSRPRPSLQVPSRS